MKRGIQMDSKVEIYASGDSHEIRVQFDQETVWLTQAQLCELFERDQSVISRHIRNIFKEGELEKDTNMQKMHIPGSDKPVAFYDLDVIISVGYRVKSQQGVLFRKWATQRLKDYLIQGYTINEQRLAQKQQEVEYLKTGIRILGRAIEEHTESQTNDFLGLFGDGLSLLDDYDHEALDSRGSSETSVNYPDEADYLAMIREMYSDFESDVFAKPKDNSFASSVGQISQSFGGKDLYLTLEEKAANLFYYITKNHSFVDGNKRIAAACFLLFLNENNALLMQDGTPCISNEALAALTLFVAVSKPDEADTVKKLVISILNRSKQT